MNRNSQYRTTFTRLAKKQRPAPKFLKVGRNLETDRLTFFFSAPGRTNLRQLQSGLEESLGCLVELRQVGSRERNLRPRALLRPLASPTSERPDQNLGKNRGVVFTLAGYWRLRQASLLPPLRAGRLPMSASREDPLRIETVARERKDCQSVPGKETAATPTEAETRQKASGEEIDRQIEVR